MGFVIGSDKGTGSAQSLDRTKNMRLLRFILHIKLHFSFLDSTSE